MAISLLLTLGAVLKATQYCDEAKVGMPLHSAVAKTIPLALSFFRQASTIEMCIEGVLVGLDLYYSREEDEDDLHMRIQRTLFGALMGVGAATLYRTMVAAHFRGALYTSLRVDRLVSGGILNYGTPIVSNLLPFFQI